MANVGSTPTGSFVVNIPGNNSSTPASSPKRTWGYKRFHRKVGLRRTAKQIAARKYIRDTETRILDEWVGYPQLATFQSSIPNFSLYRGFRYLHGRVLLDLQDEVATLERELDEFDRADKEGNANQERTLRSRAFDIRESKKQKKVKKDARTRRDVLGEIRAKLVDYDDLLFRARDIAAFRKPSHGDYKSVKQWFFNKKPLLEAGREAEFINYKDDIVSLHQGREWAAFDGILITLLRWFNMGFIQNFFRTAELRKKAGTDHSVKLYTAERIETFVNLLLTPVLCAMLVLPIVAMYALNISGARSAYRSAVVVLIVFTLLFAGSMPFFTKAGRNEIFAASAAYCAVLVVFISNFSTSPHAP